MTVWASFTEPVRFGWTADRVVHLFDAEGVAVRDARFVCRRAQVALAHLSYPRRRQLDEVLRAAAALSSETIALPNSCEPATLAVLAWAGSPAMRWLVAGHRNTPDSVLAALADDADALVARAAELHAARR